MSQFQDRVETLILPYVHRPQRYAGREPHRIVKPQAELRFALAFPDLYEIGMSSLAMQILYHCLNSSDDAIACERAFLPEEDAAARFRATGLFLPTLETRTPLNRCDIVGISLSYEMVLPGMLELLDLGGIPLRSSRRGPNDPIVIAGGPVVFNPEPFAEFVDLIALGDGEELAVEIARTALSARRRGLPREAVLAELAELEGMYRPAAHTQVETPSGRLVTGNGSGPVVTARLLEDLQPHFYPDKPLLPLSEITFDRLSFEVMRGCTRGCRFCQAGTLYRPVRERRVEDVVAQARANVRATGYNEISLTSLSTSDYSPLPELIDALQEEFRGQGISLAFPSLRPDSFTPEMAAAFPESRKAGITFAPEAGSQRLRDVINKNSREEDLLRAAQLAFDEGYNSVKLYFMMGLPSETDDDLRAIAGLSSQVARLRTSGRQRVSVSVNPFAPKANTPFQRFGQVPVDELKRRREILRHEFRGLPVRLSVHDPESTLFETVIARGDRRLNGVLERVWRNGGVLEAWYDRFDPERWLQAFRDEQLDPHALSGEIPIQEKLPWGHITKGVHDRFHEREWKKAVKARITGDCREGKCHSCGLERMIPEDAIVCNLYPVISRRSPSPVLEIPPPSQVAAFARVQYKRGPELRWSGHLDFVRLWERVLRRGNIPVAYTQGFSPHARLGFSPPLPVGLQSEAEFLDINLTEAVEASQLLREINSAVPDGLLALRTVVFRQRTDALAAVLKRSVYGFPNPDTGTFELRLREFLATDSFTIIRRNKGREKRVDLRRFVHALTRNQHVWELQLETIEGSSARLDELAGAWEAPTGFLATVTKLHAFAAYGLTFVSPLELPQDVLSRCDEAA